MNVQASIQNKILAFVLGGLNITRNDAIIVQDAGRSIPLLFGTLMCKVAATQKWTTFTDETATDGTANPQGIYLGADITAAAIVAGDVVDVAICVGEALIDVNQLVIENSKTLDTIIGVTSVNARTVRDQLAFRSIFAEDTINISNFEN